MNTAGDFAKMLPGMDFLQGLMRNAGAAIPGLNNWVTPTLDPEELDKRIQDLRTVQFWLEQNAKLLSATIQGLEVQRMTLTTLQTMNLPLADLAQALQARVPAAPAGSVSGSFSAPASSPPPAAAAAPAWAPAPAPAPAPVEAAAPPAPPAEPAPEAAATPLVDPMKWWGALTQQFGEIAAKALKDGVPASSVLPKAAPAGRTAARAGADKAVKAGTKAGAKAGSATGAGASTRAKPKPSPRPAARKAAAKRGGPTGRA